MPASDSCGRQTRQGLGWNRGRMPLLRVARSDRNVIARWGTLLQVVFAIFGKHRIRLVRWGREFLLGTIDISADLALF